MAKILLLDGNSLAYRAFFALPTDLATASGQVTNAVFGFTSMLINLLKDHKPDGIGVAFDRPEPTFRHELVPDYKAGRAEAPDILRQQMGLVRQVLEALKIPMTDAPGYEADDVIATLATQAKNKGDEVIVVTGDRDEYQLVEDPCVKVLYNRRGVSDYVLYDEAGIKEKTGVTPAEYPQYAALRGDPSDNLPGVPGVGEKTAAKLINTYGDLDGIFANVDKNTPKLRASLETYEAQVRQNAQATPLVRDVPLDVSLDDLRMGQWDAEEVRNLFTFLEFRTLWDRLLEAVGGPPAADAGPAETLDVDLERLATAEDAVATLQRLAGSIEPVAVGVAWAGIEGRSPLLALAFATGEAPATAQFLTADLLADQKVAGALAALVSDGGPPLEAHRAKESMRALDALGVDIRSLDLDTAVAAYLVDPGESDYLLEDLTVRYVGLELRSADAPPAGQLDLDGSADKPAEDAGRRAVAVARLAPALRDAMAARNLFKLYDDIERPLIRVLARMEKVGVRVDVEYLRDLIAGLETEVRRLEKEIQDDAGETFVVNSTQQLRRILFEKLGLQTQKRTKTGFSTDAASLEKLRAQHPIIEKLLRYREVEKLRSTYGESLLAFVSDDDRIHASFNQTVARTGRLSSENPNLHNIPIRREEGRRFRRAFIPADGWQFLVADYNQIELRVIAHLAEDPGLIGAFTSGQDIHATTAARVFGVDPGDVDLNQRSTAKMVSYGLAYGMEAYGLGQRLGIPTEDAALILSAYFQAFPKVKEYMERVVAEARDRGYTETMFGRRRQIPELSSTNYRIRQAGERQAMNAGIQGLAADIFKIALVRLDKSLEEEGLESRLVLQVHDEVILEVPPDEHDRAAELTLAAMSGACELCVDLAVNVSWGDSWADAKG
ncbi:MAG: DNA polymerase I [Actinobacteria bacterium]|nr:MAG: DNA polymerase I [Actinomycetota bacterium]